MPGLLYCADLKHNSSEGSMAHGNPDSTTSLLDHVLGSIEGADNRLSNPAVLFIWMGFDLPLGPGAGFSYSINEMAP
ncbi:MAG: hypothetical protein HOH74_17730 [Gemmatimonadetes bacterium]|jgi:hypothetical protein|nr:hypothetical protein [Gemmatimonadota bacterium]MBT6147280.1 hypothetical protein [Gemmatimonadota bacterium]